MENELFGVSATPLTETDADPDPLKFMVQLKPDWFRKIDLDGFNAWTDRQGIKETDWDFRVTALSDERPIIAFRRKDDALAFVLRFGL